MHPKYPSVTTTGIEFDKIKFFNAGILVFNLDVWRNFDFMEQSLDLFEFKRSWKGREDIPWILRKKKRAWKGVTQVVMNLLYVINGIEVGGLDILWNFVLHDHGFKCDGNPVLDKGYAFMLHRAKIIHWAGMCKPWRSANGSTLMAWSKYVPKNANIAEWEQSLNKLYELGMKDGIDLNIKLHE